MPVAKQAPFGRDRCVAPANPRSGLRGKALELAEAGIPLREQIKQAQYAQAMASRSSSTITQEDTMSRSTDRRFNRIITDLATLEQLCSDAADISRILEGEPVPAVRGIVAQVEPGAVTVSDLATELDVTPFEVRRTLRALGTPKVNGRYQWPSLIRSPLTQVRQQLAA